MFLKFTECMSEKSRQQQILLTCFVIINGKSENKTYLKVNIDQVKVEEIHKQLKNAINQQSVDSELLNCIASETSSLLQNSASKCLKKPNVMKYTKSYKPWFGYKCRNARRKYLSARKRYNVRPSSGNKAHLTNIS